MLATVSTSQAHSCRNLPDATSQQPDAATFVRALEPSPWPRACLRHVQSTTVVRRQATAVVQDTLLNMLICGEQNQRPVAQVRDKALLLVAFCGALRRSEITALEVSDITFLQTGMDVLIRKSKTDAEGHGETIFLPHAKGTRCPVHALKDWLAQAGIEDGPIFRAVTRGDRVLRDALSPQSVALIVKRAALRIGANADDFSGHSLRAGFCTEASTAQLANWQIRAVSRHVNDVHLAAYVRPLSNKTPSLL